MQPNIVHRKVLPLAGESLANFRVLIVNGPRQAGKTTLLRLLRDSYSGNYVTLDDNELRNAVRAAPTELIATEIRPLLIDEIQRGGNDLVLAIKMDVDDHHERGQYVLAGSTRFLSDPSLSESLAGRAVVLELWQLSEQELADSPRSFIDRAFLDPAGFRGASESTLSRDDYLQLVCRGYYPEVLELSSPRLRSNWFATYLQAIIDTDIREMTQVNKPGTLRQLVTVAAANTAQEFNASKAGNDLQLDRVTVQNYLTLLESVFLVRSLPPWSRNPHAKAVHRHKLHITDTGLAAYLLRTDPTSLASPVSPSRGALIESFITNELAKQATWSETATQLYHWRVSRGPEVDLVLEATGNRIIGVECKANSSIRLDDFRGLIALRDAIGADFVHGYVFYTGRRALPFGDRLTALPISRLWEG